MFIVLNYKHKTNFFFHSDGLRRTSRQWNLVVRNVAYDITVCYMLLLITIMTTIIIDGQRTNVIGYII